MSGRRRKKREGERKTQKNADSSLSALYYHQSPRSIFFPSTLVEGIRKKEHRHAYLISFSTGSHKRNCQDTFRNVSIKSKSSRNGGVHEWFEIIGRLKRRRCLSLQSSRCVVSLFSHSSEGAGSVDRGVILHARGLRLAEDETGWERMWTLKKQKQQAHRNCAASWSLIWSKDGGRDQNVGLWDAKTGPDNVCG